MTLKKNIAHVSSEGIRHVGLSPWLSSKESACNAGDTGAVSSIPGLGRSPGGGPSFFKIHNSYLENAMQRGTWLDTVHGVAEIWTWLKRLSRQTKFGTLWAWAPCDDIDHMPVKPSLPLVGTGGLGHCSDQASVLGKSSVAWSWRYGFLSDLACLPL